MKKNPLKRQLKQMPSKSHFESNQIKLCKYQPPLRHIDRCKVFIEIDTKSGVNWVIFYQISFTIGGVTKWAQL